jgi:hypothetical protein
MERMEGMRGKVEKERSEIKKIVIFLAVAFHFFCGIMSRSPVARVRE